MARSRRSHFLTLGTALAGALLLSAGCGSKGNSVVTATESVPASGPTTPGPKPIPLVCDATLIAGYGGGSGTLADPYAICSLLHWNYFASDSASWGKYFKLYADIDFTGVTASTFKSIGTAATAFTGKFDGNGYRLKNLALAGLTTDLALFVKTDGNASITNLTIKNLSLKGTSRYSGLVLDHGTAGLLTLDQIVADTIELGGMSDFIGGLVGSVGSAVISNVTMSSVTFLAPGSTSDAWGGVIGRVENTVTASNISLSNLTLNNLGGDQIGGLIGYIGVMGTISDVSITGLYMDVMNGGGAVGRVLKSISLSRVKVTGNVDAGYQGGGLIWETAWMGDPSTVSITESSFDGPIYAANLAGGLIGISYGSNITISKSYYNGTIPWIWGGWAGGLVGYTTGANTLAISDSYAISNLTNTHATNIVISGLVGTVAGGGTATIARSYYSGSLTSTALKACIGRTNQAAGYTVTDTYYNSTLCTANMSTTGAIAGVTGLATAALQTSTPFTNWSTSVWKFTSGQNPKLAWQP